MRTASRIGSGLAGWRRLTVVAAVIFTFTTIALGLLMSTPT